MSPVLVLLSSSLPITSSFPLSGFSGTLLRAQETLSTSDSLQPFTSATRTPWYVDPRRSSSTRSSHLADLFSSLQAFLHRPFLPSLQHPITTSPTFMATTFSAALEAVEIMNEFENRTGQLPAPGLFACYVSLSLSSLLFVFNPYAFPSLVQGSAMVLCLCVWGGASTSGNGAMDASTAMGGVETCVSLLERHSKKFWGLLQTV